jgi:hypothetical protein
MTFLLAAPSGSGFLIVIAVFIYFVPSIIAYRKKKRDVTPILLINIFLGWTLIGWVVALIWAVSSEKKITDREKMLQLQEENNRLLNEIANQRKGSETHVEKANADNSEDLLEKALSTLETSPNPEYDEQYAAMFPEKKSTYKIAYIIIILSIILATLLIMHLRNESGNDTQLNDTTTSNAPDLKTDFEVTDHLNFNSNNDHVNFGGYFTIKNNTDLNFSKLIFNERYLRIEYSDNTSIQYDILMIGRWKFKPGTANKIEVLIDYYNNTPYITLDDLQRTPQKVFFKCDFNAVNVEKEFHETFEVDVLPEWIALQKEKGIR